MKPIAFALAPAVAAVGAALFLGEPFTVKKALGLALVAAGVVTLTTKG